MSPSNVEVIRRLIERFNAREGRLAEVLAPDAVLDFSESIARPGIHRGAEAIERFMDEWFAMWDSLTWTAESMTEAPPNRVVVATRLVGRNARTGIEVDASSGHLWEVVEGQVTYMKLFQSYEEAIRAAGV